MSTLGLYPILPRPAGVDLNGLGVYVDRLVRRLYADSNITTETASYTVASDIHWVRINTASGNLTATLPPAADGYGRKVGIIKTTSDSNTVTPTASSGDTLNNNKTLRRQWESIVFVSSSGTTWDGMSISAGTVSGPTSSTDNAVARFDGTTGGLLQNSAFIVDDSGHVTSFGGNITFPATQAASSNANTLDDYEEGTFTPTLEGSTTAGTQTYDQQLGRYIKIGKMVHIQLRILLTAKDGTTSGNMRITGIPFTAVTANAGASLTIGDQSLWDLNVAGGYYSMVCRVITNSTLINLLEVGDNVASTPIGATDFFDTSEVFIAGSYEVSA